MSQPLIDEVPSISVTRGNPTDEELAAVVAVMLAISSVGEDDQIRENTDRPIAGGWKSYWRRVRQPFVHGPEAWRGSLR